MCEAFQAGIPPPVEALKRVEGFTNFRILPNTMISQIHFDGSEVLVKTNRGTYAYDFLILGTGFHVDGYQQPELRHVIDHIALWKDRLPAEMINKHPKMGSFPYLGPSFEFLPKEPGSASYLKNLYCYNYGATLSHGLLSSDIPAISIGATRLAQGIAADFFVQESEWYLECLKDYQTKDFEQTDFQLIFH
jgi:cation diffusion facilitator CzcD-associated flavoprotein CzcO